MATTSPVATPSWRSPRARHNTSSANCLPVFCRLPVIVTTSSLRRVERRVRHWQMWGSEYENLLLILWFFWVFQNSSRKLESAVLYEQTIPYLLRQNKVTCRWWFPTAKSDWILWLQKPIFSVTHKTFVKLVFIFFFLFFLFKKKSVVKLRIFFFIFEKLHS